jgi:DNA-binding NarL/FixJ family response regulator
MRLWRGLVEGRWSLVDRWESDGRRYIAVHANAPAQRDLRALSAAEQATLSYLLLGASNKEIAFTLGLPLGSIATRVRAVMRKLRAATRRDLVGMDHGDAIPIELEGERLALLRSRRVDDSELVRCLTRAEREVLDLVARGASNERIARLRGRSVKTVANQVASILTKLNVESRTEAVARVFARAPLRARAR